MSPNSQYCLVMRLSENSILPKVQHSSTTTCNMLMCVYTHVHTQISLETASFCLKMTRKDRWLSGLQCLHILIPRILTITFEKSWKTSAILYEHKLSNKTHFYKMNWMSYGNSGMMILKTNICWDLTSCSSLLCALWVIPTTGLWVRLFFYLHFTNEKTKYSKTLPRLYSRDTGRWIWIQMFWL